MTALATVAPVAVTLSTTAAASAGMPARPATWTSVMVPAPRDPMAFIDPSIVDPSLRESKNRAGTTGEYAGARGVAVAGVAGVTGARGLAGAAVVGTGTTDWG